MAVPAILTVDDEPEVLRAVERDLRRKYGRDYRILGASSGSSAIELLQQLKTRGDSLALTVADQRMPQLSGLDVLSQSMQLFPRAKRTLLTAYADTNAAIAAINTAKIDYYLLKPWDPPEEKLYPVLDDLLYDWQAGYKAPYNGVRVLGSRWSPASHQLKEFLGSNQVPYQWTDVEIAAPDPDVQQLIPNVDLKSGRPHRPAYPRRDLVLRLRDRRRRTGRTRSRSLRRFRRTQDVARRALRPWWTGRHELAH